MTWNYELFIDGAWTSEGAEGSIDVVDPATEEVIGSVPEATTKTAVSAIEAARRAFDQGPWPYMKPSERAARLTAMAEILESRAGDLRELIIVETGSTGFLTDAVQGAGSIGMLRSNAAIAEHSFPWVENDLPTGAPTGMSGSALVREPIGVVAAITPFNFPFMLNVVKVAPVLAAGCTVVLKPHPWTPLDAMMIAEVAAEAGIPPGVLNVITGHGEVGDELTSNPMVDMVTFTGSTATGRRIMASASATVKRVQLELGGKSANGRPGRRGRGVRPHHRVRAGADALRTGMRAAHAGAAPRAAPRRVQGGAGRNEAAHHDRRPPQRQHRPRTPHP